MKMREARIELNDDGSFHVSMTPKDENDEYMGHKAKTFSAKGLGECMAKMKEAMDEMESMKVEKKKPKRDTSLKTFIGKSED